MPTTTTAPTPTPAPAPARNAHVAEPIRAIVNGFATTIPMGEYAASVKRSVEGTLDRLSTFTK